MSCHLDSILMALWAVWCHAALTVGNSAALFKQIFDFVATKMNSALTTTDMLNFHRDQLWTVLENAGLQDPPGMTADVNEVLRFILERIGTVALNANFEVTYTVIEHCNNCGHFVERPRMSESYFDSNETFALPEGVTRLYATLSGVSRTQECPNCEEEQTITYRSGVKPNHALIISNINTSFNDLETEWPLQAEHDHHRIKLVAIIVSIRGHFLCICKEPGLQWLVYDDIYGVSRNTWDNIKRIFYRSADTSLDQTVLVVTLVYVRRQ